MATNSIYVHCCGVPHSWRCPGRDGESSVSGHLSPFPEVSSIPWELWSTWPPRGAGDTAASLEHSLRSSSGWGHGARGSLGHFQMAWGFETAVGLNFRLIFREWFLPARALGWESGVQLRSPAPAQTAGSSWGREGLVFFTKLHTCEN